MNGSIFYGTPNSDDALTDIFSNLAKLGRERRTRLRNDPTQAAFISACRAAAYATVAMHYGIEIDRVVVNDDENEIPDLYIAWNEASAHNRETLKCLAIAFMAGAEAAKFFSLYTAPSGVIDDDILTARTILRDYYMAGRTYDSDDVLFRKTQIKAVHLVRRLRNQIRAFRDVLLEHGSMSGDEIRETGNLFDFFGTCEFK